MSQPISQTQKISAVVLSISLCASTVFAYQKQQTPQEQTRRVSAIKPSNPRLDAAQIAALDAEANKKAKALAAAQQTAFNAEIDAIARQYAPKTNQDEALKNVQQPIKTIPFNLSAQSEVHVIGVHTAYVEEGEHWAANCGHTEGESLICFEEMRRKEALGGTVEVIVNYPKKPIVLVLTALERVHWKIKVSAGTQIEQVIISGNRTQEYSGLPHSTPVAIYTLGSSVCSTPCWRGDGYFHTLSISEEGSSGFQRKIQEITGKPIYSFQGAHRGKTFNIFSGIPKISYETPNPS